MEHQDPRKLNRNETGSDPLTSVNITCEVLHAIHHLDDPGVTEIADQLNYSKSTVHNHLSTLVDNHFLIRYESDNPIYHRDEYRDPTYRLSFRFLAMAERMKAQYGPVNVISDEIRALAEETGELALFAVPEYGRIVYLARAESGDCVDTDVRVGETDYLHTTALGKAILSEYVRRDVDSIIDRYGLPECTEATRTDRAAFFDAIEAADERGYAIEDEENVRGLRGLAVPVCSDERVLGAVGVCGPARRLDDVEFEAALTDTLKQTANVIELKCQFS
jgi:DNA-binding IclR family transcriptional regulator